MHPADSGGPGWAEPGSEQRTSLRRRVLKHAKVVYNNGYSVIDASLHDISATGAQIRLLTPATLPDEFELHLGDGRKLRVEVVWQNAATLGVRFVNSGGITARPCESRTGSALLDRIAAIEESLAELRREITARLGE